MNKVRLAEAAKFANEGKLSNSLQLLQKEASHELTHIIASNIAAIYLQLGNISEALNFATKAINLDPYSYIGYFNRFLCLFSQNKALAKLELEKALSCLYLMKGYEEKNIKLLNKAIFYCQRNAKAYLFRAKINEGKNNKLAENDYSAALEYDENLAQIYQQRALYYRKINKIDQFEQDCIKYLRLKQLNHPINQLVNNDNQFIQSQQQITSKIQQQVQQYYEILERVHRKNINLSDKLMNESVSKLPLSSIQSRIDKKQDQQLLLSDRPDPQQGSTQTITIKKEEIQFKKKLVQQNTGTNYRQFFEDEQSGELDDRIGQLQKQIEEQGGKISVENKKEQQQLDLSDPTNFLTQEIEKAILEISKMSSPDTLNDIRSARSAETESFRNNQPKQLTIEQFSKFHSVNIEVVNLQDLQAYNKRQTAKVLIKYGERKFQTGMNKYEWRESFNFGLSSDCTEVDVVVIEKGGIFKSDFIIGQGTINLLQRNNVKCILGNKEKKVAILYFKIQLI